jgi:hypothetical protein
MAGSDGFDRQAFAAGLMHLDNHPAREDQVEGVGYLALAQEELARLECGPAGTLGDELDSTLGLTGQKSVAGKSVMQ